MICIRITDEAYEVLKAGNPHIEDLTARGRNGQLREIWVDRTFLDQLLAARHPRESYSDVILRLARG